MSKFSLGADFKLGKNSPLTSKAADEIIEEDLDAPVAGMFDSSSDEAQAAASPVVATQQFATPVSVAPMHHHHPVQTSLKVKAGISPQKARPKKRPLKKRGSKKRRRKGAKRPRGAAKVKVKAKSQTGASRSTTPTRLSLAKDFSMPNTNTNATAAASQVTQQQPAVSQETGAADDDAFVRMDDPFGSSSDGDDDNGDAHRDMPTAAGSNSTSQHHQQQGVQRGSTGMISDFGVPSSTDEVDHMELFDDVENLLRQLIAQLDIEEFDSTALRSQLDAIVASKSHCKTMVDVGEAMTQTVQNFCNLAAHLVRRDAETENELLALSQRMEIQAEKAAEVKDVMIKKREALAAEKKKVEADLLAAEKRNQVYQMEIDKMTQQMEDERKAVQELQQYIETHEVGLKPEEAREMKRLTMSTMRGSVRKRRQIDEEIANDLIAELHNLDVTSVGDSVGDDDMSFSKREKTLTEYRRVVNELITDNDNLQMEVLKMCSALKDPDLLVGRGDTNLYYSRIHARNGAAANPRTSVGGTVTLNTVTETESELMAARVKRMQLSIDELLEDKLLLETELLREWGY